MQTALTLILVAIITYLIFSGGKTKIHICKDCGESHPPKNQPGGSITIEVIVWIASILLAAVVTWLFILAALTYSLWRIGTTVKVCRTCKSINIIPADTPVGREIAKQYGKSNY